MGASRASLEEEQLALSEKNEQSGDSESEDCPSENATLKLVKETS